MGTDSEIGSVDAGAAGVEPLAIRSLVPAGGSAEACWPAALTPPLRHVLGLLCFQLGSYAHVYQQAGEFVAEGGEELKKRAEDEQAFMLHKLVGFVLSAGDDWAKLAQDDLNRARASIKAAQA